MLFAIQRDRTMTTRRPTTFRASTLVWAATSLIALAALAIPARAQNSSEPSQLAAEILNATGVQGGLVVHLGCGDGRLTAALRVADSFQVQGLDRDPAAVQKAREFVKSQGTYGDV